MNTRACRLADTKTLQELAAMRDAVTSDPKNANPEHAAGRSIYLYTPAARKRLDELAWAVTYKLRQLREERGDPVVADGYSGRGSNR